MPNRTRARGERRSVAFLCGVAVALLPISGCAGGDDVPEAPDPVAMLAASADRMENVGSFAFTLEHENGTTAIGSGLQMVTAQGRMSGSDRLQAQVRAMAGPLTVDVEIVVLPQGSWMTNPLTRAWTTTTLSVSQFFDPGTGIPALMRAIPQATLVGTEVLEGVEVHRVDAQVGTQDLVGLVPDAAVGRTIQARFWIGVSDPTLHRLEIVGPVKDGEADTILRRLGFAEFGAPVDILPPV